MSETSTTGQKITNEKPVTSFAQATNKVADKKDEPRAQTTTIVKSTSVFNWLMIVIALALAAAAFFYSYTQSQQSTNAYAAQRTLLLERINRLERDQDTLFTKTQQEQQQLIDEVQQSVEEINQQITQTPSRITEMLLGQLVHQAQLLINARASYSQAIVLLSEAHRMANGNYFRHNTIRAALEADLAQLNAAQAEQSSVSVFTQINLLRKQIRALSFTPAENPTIAIPVPEHTSDNLWDKIHTGASNLFNKLVVVRRHQGAANLDLSQEQFGNIKLLIESTLAQAQAAMLLGNSLGYTESLQHAEQLTTLLLPRYPLDNYRDAIGKLQQTALPPPVVLESVQAIQALEAH